MVESAFPFTPELRDRLRANLERHRVSVATSGGRSAAVAVALVPSGAAAAFVITRRSERLKNHPGQWALPGGRIDGGESAEEAALRELDEEVGVAVGAEAVLGRLDDYETRSGFVITPVVIWAGDVELVADPVEVAEVHRVPIAELERPDAPRFISIPESDRPVIQLPLVGTLIHAPTAAVLYQFRQVAMRGESTRVGHLEQPVWAWR